MLIGFGKTDITPRLGVELYGYSGYLNRYGSAVRSPLHATALAAGDGANTVVVVSCDIILIPAWLAAEVRRRVGRATGLAPEQVMVHATHTHSGPCIRADYRNAYDPPYMELLPRRIARACIEAVQSMTEATLHHAEVPCEGVGANRVYDTFNYREEALAAGFRPKKPELTDTTCHVFKAVSGDRVLGFASYFGCHNVVGGSGSTYIHGDYAGIATRMLEEQLGAPGLFLQGAEGDVNVAACCFADDMVLRALDVMASRYAKAVTRGLDDAQPLPAGPVRCARRELAFTRQNVPMEVLKEKLAVEEAVTGAPEADDADGKYRMAILRALALRDIIERKSRGESFENPTEVQALRIGPVTLLGSPCETFQAIKNDVAAAARSPIALLTSCTNDEQGYATDRTARDNPTDYAAHTVPLWKHTLPYEDIHTELTDALLALDAKVND